MYGADNYGRQVLLNPTSYPTGGMAMPDINPRGGVFGPQGYGGGIFDGMSGLGQASSADIRSWQGLLNVELRERGLEVIPVTGAIDAATCGATLALTNSYNAGDAIYGPLADALDAGTGIAIASECSSVPEPWPAPKARLGTMQMLLYGGVGAVAFFGVAMLVRKKRRR